MLSVLLIPGCTSESQFIPENPLFYKLDKSKTGVAFSNNVSPTQEFNIFTYRNFYNGGGVAVGDVNNDDLPDIYMVANQGANKLFLNQGDFTFTDVTEQAGVAGTKPWSTGVAMADVNGDGLLDIYVLNSADIGGNNRANELFINQGDGNFSEEAKAYNLDDPAYSVHASFFDYDADGDLDCYLVNNSFKGTGPNMRTLLSQSRDGVDAMGGDKLLRNDGGLFTDVSQEAGIHQGAIGFGLGAIVGDVNGDHRPDIYVSNDFWERDYLYINQGNGQFRDELTSRTSHVSQSSMGSDIGDINNDGRMDIFTTDMLPTDAARIKTMTVFDDYHVEDPQYHDSYHYQYVQNTLQLNNGNGTFSETGFLSGVAATDWSWGALMFDFSNNGWKDLFVSNGIFRDVTDKDFRNFISDRSNIAKIVRERGAFDILDFLERMPSQKIKNVGFRNNKDKTFTRDSDSLGFYQPTFSSGAAYGDLDNDGDLDLVVNNLNENAFIYRNDSDRFTNNHFLKLKFEGSDSNKFGIGASVKIVTGKGRQVGQNMSSRSFQSSVPPELHFGLADQTKIDSLVVTWPDRSRQVLTGLEADQAITLRYEEADSGPEVEKSPQTQPPLLQDVTSKVISGDITHRENHFIDFEQNRLLPHMLSTTGPELSIGDMNGDGRDDIFMTGAMNQQDKLFFQQPEDGFTPYISADLAADSVHESTAAELVDLDTDGDLDLIIANGGNQYELESPHNQVRAYVNRGDGTYIRAPELAPSIQIDASCIRANDIDNDGDMDLFIGARMVPKRYGENPRSYLLQNNGKGQWTDITPQELQTPGMVTDAVWTDWDGDGDDDLTVVGEWMPVTLFVNNNGTLNFDRKIEQSSGWWSAVHPTDVDSDGDIDFVLGNWGRNSKFDASPKKPISMYVNDFNGDGKPHAIITTYQPGDDTAYPFATYNDLVVEMPFLQERIPGHHDFAEQTYEQIFTRQERSGALEKQVQTLSSSILINNEGSFSMKALPLEAQVSPVFSVVSQDFNEDQTMDLLLLGNLHGLKPEVGRLADNYGVFLYNDGAMNFTFQPYYKTHNFIQGEVRDAQTITIGGEQHIIVSRNDDTLMIFRPN